MAVYRTTKRTNRGTLVRYKKLSDAGLRPIQEIPLVAYNAIATGHDTDGQSGIGFSGYYFDWTNVLGEGWADCAVGLTHTILLNKYRYAYGCGNGYNGELGNGSTEDKYTPTLIPNIKFIKISCGWNNSVGVDTAGRLLVWGYNSIGQLGLGDTDNRLSPTQLGTASNWITTSTAPAEETHSAAINSLGEMWVWGDNSSGQLGLGDTDNRPAPVQMGTASNWTDVWCGPLFTIAKNANGELYSFGDNTYGKLGIGSTTQQNSPIKIGNDTDWLKISTGYDHVIALKTTGELYTWGCVTYGELGNGRSSGGHVLSPEKIGTDTDWVDVAAGNSHSLAVKSTGALLGCGSNDYGGLGTGMDDDGSYVFKTINTGTTFTRCFAGYDLSIAFLVI